MVNGTWDPRPFVAWISDAYLPSAKVGPGPADYGLRPGAPTTALYGVADAACILYTIDELDGAGEAGRAWLTALGAYQDPESGFFVAKTASLAKAHNAGFAIAAMNLFEPKLANGILPEFRLAFAELIADTVEATRYADSLDWRGNTYEAGERLIGLASCFFNVTGVVEHKWFEWLVDYVERTKLDPANGMVGVDKPPQGDDDQIGGTFHFDFFWASLDRQLPYAPPRASALLGLQHASGLWDPNNPWWLTFDAVYMLGRALPELSADLTDAAMAAIERAVDVLFERSADLVARTADFGEAWMGVHNLTGAISFFAYAQQVLGDEAVVTERPLQLVLDRRPYI
jgi:hypothetical protein